MSSRAYATAAAAALIVIGLGPPAARAASSGGGQASGGTAAGGAGAGPSSPGAGASSPGAGAGASSPGAAPQPLGPAVWLRQTVRIPGNLGPGAAGQPVLVERFSPSQGRWVTVAQTQADDQGAFSVSWRATETGHLAFRARVANARAGTAQADSSTTAGTPIGEITVYRADLATWFGPGSYGRKTACGEQMTHRLLGVASRTLPCGTMVELSYEGKALTVPVVDRGPYSRARWDLTYATARALDFAGSGRIGTLVLGQPGPASSGPSGASGA